MPRLNAVAARLLGAREYTDDSWRVFVAERKVRFRESEYAVPRAAVARRRDGGADWLEQHRAPLTFPLEIRFTGADDIWLSTAYERENAYIAIHQYHRMDDHGAFAAFEAIVAEHAGRPHWGKLHTLGADRAARALSAVRRLPGGAGPARPAAPVRQPLPRPGARGLTGVVGRR